MSGDEVTALLVSAILGLYGWQGWIGGLLRLQSLSRRWPTQLLAGLTPPVAGLAIYCVLCKWSSQDVRQSPGYILFYMLMWFGWTGLWHSLLPRFGLSCRDDALERGNTAAGAATAGALLGVTFAFAGANIGDGPGWYVVAFSAGLATAALLGLWFASTQITNVHDAIVIDRDLAAGLRTGGFFVGTGLILGRAVAGNWHSSSAALGDFITKGWPALILWVILVAFDAIANPTPQRPAPNRLLLGALPALLFIIAGIVVVIFQGSWQ